MSQTAAEVILRDPARDGERVTIEAADIDEVVTSKLSIMPPGIVNQLSDRKQFLDLLRYVLDVRDGGVDMVRLDPLPPDAVVLFPVATPWDPLLYASTCGRAAR